jgi:hypothetical protein
MSVRHQLRDKIVRALLLVVPVAAFFALFGLIARSVPAGLDTFDPPSNAQVRQELEHYYAHNRNGDHRPRGELIGCSTRDAMLWFKCSSAQILSDRSGRMTPKNSEVDRPDNVNIVLSRTARDDAGGRGRRLRWFGSSGAVHSMRLDVLDVLSVLVNDEAIAPLVLAWIEDDSRLHGVREPLVATGGVELDRILPWRNEHEPGRGPLDAKHLAVLELVDPEVVESIDGRLANLGLRRLTARPFVGASDRLTHGLDQLPARVRVRHHDGTEAELGVSAHPGSEALVVSRRVRKLDRREFAGKS